jgi:hypothetical protein
MNTTDENLILRFASGELDAEEEATFLAGCEISPDGWRDAVLAVAEHRHLVEALGEMAAESTPSALGSRTRRRAGRWRSLPAVAAAALAAGLLLGIVGTHETNLLGNRRPQVADAPVINISQPPVSLSSDGAAPNPGDIPWMQPIISESQKAVLRAHGFQVEEKPGLYIIPAGNGTQCAIPTQQAELHYVKH